MPFIYLIIAVVLNSIANVMLKISSTKGLQLHGVKFATITDNMFLVGGLSLFALNVIFYYLALSNISLSIAYPILVGATFLLVNAIAYFFLKEQVSPMQFIGYMLIILGIIMVMGLKQT